VISGTPTTVGVSTFVVRAMDSYGCTGLSASFTVSVANPTTDFGDYSVFGAATQAASVDIRIGTAATDTEATTPANATATGDDTTGTDDEDLTMPSFTVGVATNLNVPVTITSPIVSARVNVFVDWNGDGDVLDTNETLTAQTVSAAGTTNLSFSLTAPAGTTAGTKYLRIRATEGATAPAFSGASTLKGEVEELLASDGEIARIYASLALYESQMPYIYPDRETFLKNSYAHEAARTGRHVYAERSWRLSPA
jgi:hypothetical protein